MPGVTSSLSKAGRENAARAKTSYIARILNDKSDNCRAQLQRRGIKPKNHHRDNIRRMRELQKKRELKAQEGEQQRKKKSTQRKKVKAAQFKNISSKVQIHTNNNNNNNNNNENENHSNLSDTLNKKCFIQKNITKVAINSKNAKSKLRAQTKDTQQYNRTDVKATRKSGVPKRSDVGTLKRRTSKDYLNLNKNLKTVQVQEVEETNWTEKGDYGKIPDYILQRKQDKLEMEQKKMEEEEAAKIPKGMRQMSNEERLETIELLRINEKKILNDIKLLPLVIETHSTIKYAQSLRDKLTEVENAIHIFSKPVVFVCNDE